jgi:predicted nucleic acid-binding Zn ribbon protein
VPAEEHDAGAAVTPLSTERGGKPPSAVDGAEPATGVGEPAEPLDPAQAALADARAIARGTPVRRNRDAARRTRRENLAGRNRGGYSGPAADPTSDPQLLGPILSGYVADRGWDRPLADARVFADWAALVGADVAAHCAPQSLHDGELRIAAESTAWATQLRLLGRTLLARLVAELGPDVVTKLHITGPTGPSWKHGGRSVRGARGPRDTYG